MFKCLKWLIFLFFVFVSLYFFGDFRVNDVNVRSWLHQKVTVEKIMAVKDWLTRAGMELPPKEETTATVLPKTVMDVVQEPLDSISQKDKERIIRLLQSQKDE